MMYKDYLYFIQVIYTSKLCVCQAHHTTYLQTREHAAGRSAKKRAAADGQTLAK